MEVDLANPSGLLLGQNHLAAAQPWDIQLHHRQAGLPRKDIQPAQVVDIHPARVVDILDARVLLPSAKVAAAARGQPAAARGHQGQLPAANQLEASCLLVASCPLIPTAAAVARTEQAPEAPEAQS